MAKLDAKYLLKHPNAKKKSEIWFVTRFEKKRIVYPIKEPGTNIIMKIYPQLWDDVTQKPICDFKKFPQNIELPQEDIPLGETLKKVLLKEVGNNNKIKHQISQIDVAFSEIKEHSRINNINLSKEHIIENLNIKLGFIKKEETKKNISLNEYIEIVISEMESGKRLFEKNKSKYGAGTIKSFRNFQLHFSQYQSINNISIDFNDINRVFYDDFLEFLMYESEDVKDKTYKKGAFAHSTIGKIIKHLKTIMNFSFDEDLHENMEHKKKYFLKPHYEAFNVYLTEAEVKTLYELKFDENDKHLEKYRDVFLLGCYTGLRFSDYERLDNSMLQKTNEGNEVIKIITKKSDTPVVIPIIWNELLEIHKKYDNKFPKASAQNINDYIKIIAEKAKLTELFTYTKMVGGEKIEIKKKKWELITTHTGRRTAATNMYLREIPTHSIRLITGHSTEKSFKKYIKISLEENADLVMKQIKQKNEHI